MIRPPAYLPPPHAAHLTHSRTHAHPWPGEGSKLGLLLRSQNLAHFKPVIGGLFLHLSLEIQNLLLLGR